MKNEFDINELELEKEWIIQPNIYYKYAELLANARKEYEREKSKKEVVIAELDKKIRKNPEQYDIQKITETVIERVIIGSEEVKVVTKKLIQLKYQLDMYQAAIDTLEHKKKALENLVQLWIKNYYSEPSNPKGHTREEVDEIKRGKKS